METVADIIREMRGYSHGMPPSYHVTMSWHDFRVLLDRIEKAAKRESNSIERLVRDAIIDYQEMFAHAPNDDAERDLIDRAERGTAWLVAHGYEPEQLSWRK